MRFMKSVVCVLLVRLTVRSESVQSSRGIVYVECKASPLAVFYPLHSPVRVHEGKRLSALIALALRVRFNDQNHNAFHRSIVLKETFLLTLIHACTTVLPAARLCFSLFRISSELLFHTSLALLFNLAANPCMSRLTHRVIVLLDTPRSFEASLTEQSPPFTVLTNLFTNSSSYFIGGTPPNTLFYQTKIALEGT